MIRKTLLVLALVAAPALAQQPAQQPAAKPATAAAQTDTSKTKGRRARRAAHTRTAAKPKPAAPRDTTKP
jgi:hypothetical protein